MNKSVLPVVIVAFTITLGSGHAQKHHKADRCNECPTKAPVTASKLRMSIPITLFPSPLVESFTYQKTYSPSNDGQSSTENDPVWRFAWRWVVGWLGRLVYDPLTIITTVLVFLTWRYVVHAARQTRSIARSVTLSQRGFVLSRIGVNAAKDAALAATTGNRINSEQFIVRERAYVALGGFDHELSLLADAPITTDLPETLKNCDPALYITRFAVRPHWRNSGNTSTVGLTIQTGWCIPVQNLPNDFDYLYRTTPKGFFIAPEAIESSATFEVTGVNATVNDGIELVEGTPYAYVWGRADYADVFGRQHFTQWCYQVRFERHDRQRLRAYFVQTGDYNQTDDDQKRLGKTTPHGAHHRST